MNWVRGGWGQARCTRPGEPERGSNAAESSGWRHESWPAPLRQRQRTPNPFQGLASGSSLPISEKDREYPRENTPGKGEKEGRGLGSAGRGPTSVHQGGRLTIKERLGLRETGHSQAATCSH